MESAGFLSNGRDGGDGDRLHGNQGTPEGERPEDKMTLCIRFLKRRVHYLPIFTAVFIIVSLFISYGVSVYHGHVEPDFPYISYTAVQTPERCIFAQLINIGAVLMGANVYIRFMQQRELYKTHGHPARSHPKDRQLAIASLVCGCFSALGLSMVANFQTIVMRPPHYVGAGLAFGMGLTYCWLQTSISLRHSKGNCVTIAQLVISILLSLFLVIFAVSKAIFKVKEGRGQGTKEVELRAVYLVSTVSEWLTVMSVVVFVLTFCPDFSRLTLTGPRVQISEDRVKGQERPGNDLQLDTVTSNGHQGNPPV